MKIYLVTGYRGTGKDTLYLQLTSSSSSTSSFNWTIYGKDKNISLPFDNKIKRVAFADALKREVMEKLNLTELPSKDTLIDGITFREHLIHWAHYRKLVDEEYWCKLALSSLNPYCEDIIFITDWRYSYEYEYCRRQFPDAEIITIRVFRPEVTIPGITVDSERSLDHVKTDLVLVSSLRNYSTEEKFTLLVESFPQYRYYLKME